VIAAGHSGERGEKTQRYFGGARRNRTADKGFADLCLTTWRPRHRIRRESIGKLWHLRFVPSGQIVKVLEEADLPRPR
jgi:hypothetical protein